MRHTYFDASCRLEDIADTVKDIAHNARVSGNTDKYKHLRRAYRELRRAADVAPPVDVRQRFFEAMLEQPHLHH